MNVPFAIFQALKRQQVPEREKLMVSMKENGMSDSVYAIVSEKPERFYGFIF